MFDKKIYIDNTENLLLGRKIYSKECLSPLLEGYPYLVFTGAAIDFHSLHVMINDIVVNSRETILEFGSGMSTIIIGRLIRLNGLNAKLYSVENDEGWFALMQENIKKESLDEYIELIYAPLRDIEIQKYHSSINHSLRWFDTDVLDMQLKNKVCDMMIVDGPMAYRKDIERSRFPALPYIKEKLGSRYSIYLHDTDREGEQSIIRDWKVILGIDAKQYTEKLTGFIKGEFFKFDLD